ncbi:small ribosomal subunit protein mS29, partial [Pseudophryne corroboree]|uniref:small ribosomal subunit protein mS29 n=1 Tax=Pseudophryne corroboree TaxID=495146 RepID=UPI0030813D4F
MLVRQLRRWAQQHWVPWRAWASVVSPAEESSAREVFRTSECDPDRHTEAHEGQYYNHSPSQKVRTTFPYGLPARFQLQCKTFNETSLMVRSPALEVIQYLRNTNFSQPAVRYLLYGKNGTGKSLSLCHVLHYCQSQGWFILHLPD